MSNPVKKKTKKYEYFVITAPGFDEPSEYIFDKLLEVLKSL